MNNYYVYGLINPRNHSIFYIGKGKNKRIYQHLKEKPNLFSNIEKLNKIKEIQESGREVDFIYLSSELSEELAFFLEKILIHRLGRKIFNEGELTNIVSGGEWKKGDSYFLRPSQIPTDIFIHDFFPKFVDILEKFPHKSKKFTGLRCPSNPLDNNLYVYDNAGNLMETWNIDVFINIFGLHASMKLVNAINNQSIPIYAWNRLWSITKHEKIVRVSAIPFNDFDFVKSDFVNEITKARKLKKELAINCKLPNGVLQTEIKQIETGELLRLTGFYKNGKKKYESFLLNGVKCDTWNQWYSNGLIKSESKYLESNPIYERSYYQNGLIQKTIEYDNSGNWTTMTEWYDNGQIMFENNHRSEFKRYSRNGELVDSYKKL